MTNSWKITHNKNLNKNIAVKQYDGYITLKGVKIFVKTGSVMVEDEQKTLFTPSEWLIFKSTGFNNRVYLVKKVFDGFILTI